jgi:hypothetical protein
MKAIVLGMQAAILTVKTLEFLLKGADGGFR